MGERWRRRQRVSQGYERRRTNRRQRDETQASWPDTHRKINTTSPFSPGSPLSSVSLSPSLLATVSFSHSRTGFIHNSFFNVLFPFLCICSMALNDDSPAKRRRRKKATHVVVLLSYDIHTTSFS